MIFGAPILASIEHEVGGQTLTLYEFTADLYYEHVLNPAVLEQWDKARDAGKTEQSETDDEPQSEPQPVDYMQICETRRMAKDDKFLWIACSLSPGYPDKSVDDIIKELRANLTGVNLEKMYQKVWDLNVPAAAKKTESPAVDSSID